MTKRRVSIRERPWPDLDSRAKAIFGHRVIAPGAAEVVIEGRGVLHEVVSADDRLLAVAKASGLGVVDIKRRPRRRRK